MVEPRKDMLADFPPQEIDVPQDAKVKEDVKPEVTAVADEEVGPAVEAPKGSKTPPDLLLKSLQEERNKRRELEQKLQQLETSSQQYDLDDQALSDEGKALKREIAGLQSQIGTLTSNLELERVMSVYPQLKDKASEFNTFKADYPGVSIDKAAKLFLVENDLLQDRKPRKGLERPTGGSKVAEPSGISAAEIDRLMKNEPKKFERMLRSGEIDPDKIY